MYFCSIESKTTEITKGFLISFFLPEGMTEPTVIKDYPIRNRKVHLHVRRRR